MGESAGSTTLTDGILTAVREQRHHGVRVVIATQEPTVSPALLDLCTMTFVHRFTSPSWLATLQGHLAGASPHFNKTTQDRDLLLKEIVLLKVGESLLFSPKAMLDVKHDHATELGIGRFRLKTRKRITTDGGGSVMAVR